ncbi:hypothetical protein BNJ_00204 [Kaumoebavirus]|uniref:hypothetical protein n=1 Tax=Kaumoebavirus TaxID=1859492 RepID=UPI0009C29AD7|nr:hypothetical protein BNJ_00204 [Kaumoebavirus]ARA72035.1 hypothetical protein BNJ_00204 [Kaumoebavirus]
MEDPKVNWKDVADKITLEYPFIKFTASDDKPNRVSVGNFRYVLCIRNIESDNISITVGPTTSRFGEIDFTDIDLLANMLLQSISEVPAFRMHFFVHETKRLLKPLEEKIEELYTMIAYSPDGPEYVKAKEHFEKLI